MGALNVISDSKQVKMQSVITLRCMPVSAFSYVE